MAAAKSNIIDHIAQAGRLADMANTQQSTDVSNYYVNQVKMQPSNLPMLSYGLQITRQADAPPTDLVDTESKLKNQYDILGRSGFVYHPDGALGNRQVLPEAFSTPMAAPAPATNDFFLPVSGRDFHSFSSKACQNINIWRNDIITTTTPVPQRFPHVDTRAITKEKIDKC